MHRSVFYSGAESILGCPFLQAFTALYYSSLPSCLAEVFVLMDFEGINDELKMKAGDVIKNVRAGAEQGWMEGELNGKRGFFPSNFVKVREGR